jgi:Aldehyde dehydrogenase family
MRLLEPSYIGRSTMKAVTEKDTIRTITTHYIDGAFVESNGREVMDVIKPTNRKVIAKAALGDEEDTRRAIAAAKSAVATFGHSTKEERTEILRRPPFWGLTSSAHAAWRLSCGPAAS